MLDDKASSAIVAVRDIDRARDFYERILGLQLASDAMGVLVFRTGPTSLVVYPSGEAGSNRANAVVWGCGSDIDAIVAALAARGWCSSTIPSWTGRISTATCMSRLR